MKKSLIFFVLIVACLFGCGNDEPVKFMKVYDGATYDKEPDSLKKNTAVSGVYYAFNYKDTDIKKLLKILDTITFDTGYRYHGYRFLKYNSSLPDTTKLKIASINEDYSKLEDPGSSKFYKYQILDFSYTHSYFSEGRNFPDSYTIAFNDNGKDKLNIKYYVKDSITKKLREVNMRDVYPVDR